MELRIVEATRSEERDRRDQTKKVRMYFWPVGENVMQNLMNRRGRPHEAYRPLIAEALRLAGVAPQYGATKIKAVWSQKAGCGCGCSPGFVLSNAGRGFSVHVKITGEEHPETDARIAEVQAAAAGAMQSGPFAPLTAPLPLPPDTEG